MDELWVIHSSGQSTCSMPIVSHCLIISWLFYYCISVFFACVPTVVTITRLWLPYSSAMSLCYDDLLSYLPITMDLLQIANISMGSTGYLWNLWELTKYLQYLWLCYEISKESLWYLQIYSIYDFATIYLWISTRSTTYYDSYGLYKDFQSLLMKWYEVLEGLSLNPHMMPRDVSTRWNSTYDMLEFATCPWYHDGWPRHEPPQVRTE